MLLGGRWLWDWLLRNCVFPICSITDSLELFCCLSFNVDKACTSCSRDCSVWPLTKVNRRHRGELGPRTAQAESRPGSPAGPVHWVTPPGHTGPPGLWGSWAHSGAGPSLCVYRECPCERQLAFHLSSANLLPLLGTSLLGSLHCQEIFFLTFSFCFIFVISWSNIICAHIWFFFKSLFHWKLQFWMQSTSELLLEDFFNLK